MLTDCIRIIQLTRKTDRHIHRQTYRQRDMQTDRETCRHTHTDRHADTQTHRKYLNFLSRRGFTSFLHLSLRSTLFSLRSTFLHFLFWTTFLLLLWRRFRSLFTSTQLYDIHLLTPRVSLALCWFLRTWYDIHNSHVNVLWTYSLANSLTQSLTHSLTPLLTHSLTHSFFHSFTHSLSLTYTLTHSLTHSLTYSLTHSLIHSTTHSLTR